MCSSFVVILLACIAQVHAHETHIKEEEHAVASLPCGFSQIIWDTLCEDLNSQSYSSKEWANYYLTTVNQGMGYDFCTPSDVALACKRSAVIAKRRQVESKRRKAHDTSFLLNGAIAGVAFAGLAFLVREFKSDKRFSLFMFSVSPGSASASAPLLV